MQTNIIASAPNSEQKLYLNNRFKYFNKKFFNNKLKLPNFSILKNITKFKKLGHFQIKIINNKSVSIIALNPHLFNDLEQLDKTLVHEMCHYMTIVVDKDLDKVDNYHNNTWKKWMKHCGLEPNRYTDLDTNSLLTDKEKLKINKVKKVQQKKQLSIKEQFNSLTKTHKFLSKDRIDEGVPALFVNSDASIVYGRFVCKKVGGKWIFLPTNQSQIHYTITPQNELFFIPNTKEIQFIYRNYDEELANRLNINYHTNLVAKRSNSKWRKLLSCWDSK